VSFRAGDRGVGEEVCGADPLEQQALAFSSWCAIHGDGLVPQPAGLRVQSCVWPAPGRLDL
jgi:hypothetical protein